MPTSILIVDDSETASSLIKLHLHNLGYDIAGIAQSAEEALQLVQKHTPSLVLMDIYLGEGMDGIEAAEIIMCKYETPVIYVTSYSDNETLKRAKKSMPFGFINKPIRSNDLKVSIEIALTRFKAPEQNNPGESIQEPGALSETLDHLVSGIVLLDEKLTVHYCNKSAVKILNEHPLLSIKDRSLNSIKPSLLTDIQNLIQSKPSRILTLDDSELVLHLLVFPLSEKQLDQDVDAPTSVLFLFESIKDPTRFEDIIRTMYKLSPTEAKIASQLVVNPYLAEVAASLGITYNTARTHLKRIYYKTETNKLPSLVQKIISGPAGLVMQATE